MAYDYDDDNDYKTITGVVVIYVRRMKALAEVIGYFQTQLLLSGDKLICSVDYTQIHNSYCNKF